MNKAFTISQIAPIVIQQLQNETIPVTKQSMFNSVKEQLGVTAKSTASILQFNRIIDDMIMKGYLYTIDNVTFSLTKDAKEGIQGGQHNNFTTDYSQPHKELMTKFKNPIKAVQAIMPYWEHFKESHPEYAEVYDDLENGVHKKEFPMLLAEVWSIINNKIVQPYGNNVEPNYEYSDKLASSIDNVIANCMVRAIKFSRHTKLRDILIPNENVIDITRSFLGAGFDDVKGSLLSEFGPGNILGKNDIRKFLTELLKTNNITDHKEIDFVLRQSMSKLINSIDPATTGIMFDSMDDKVIIKILRDLLFKKSKSLSPVSTIVNRVLLNEKGTQYLSKALSNTEIPAGTKLIKCKFNNITITGSKATEVNFTGSIFSEGTISQNNLTNSSFSRCQLDVKKFTRNVVEGTDFTGSGGYNSEDVDFSENLGKPIGLVIQKAIYNTDDFNALVIGGMKRKQYNSLPLTPAERKLADPLLQHLHGFLTHKNRKLSSLDLNLSWDIKPIEVDPKKVNLLYAIYCVEAVLSIYEEQYPNDSRPRAAIEAAKACLKNPSKENRNKAYSAGYAATAAADAAYDAAIDAAAYVANAAAYYAANAAIDATDAAYADAAAYAIKYAKRAAEQVNKNIDFDSLKIKAENDIWEYTQETTSSLRFSEEMPAIPDDKSIIKQDLENLLQSGQKAEWLTLPEAKGIIIQMNKSGELATMGLAQSMGKIIGMISGPKENKPSKEQMEIEQQTQQEQKLQEVFQQHSGRGTMSKQALLDALPADAYNLRNIIIQFPNDQLDAQQISQIYAILLNSQYDSKAGDSVLLQQQLRDISQFPHGSRIDDITLGRRNPPGGEAGSKYPNTFGIILEPNPNGLPQEVKSIVDMIDLTSPHTLKNRNFTEGMPHNTHWMNAFASARVRPTYIVDNSGVEGSTQKRNVWLDVENQSDALQQAAGRGDNYFKHMVKGKNIPFELKAPETLAISKLYDILKGDMNKSVPIQDVLDGSSGFTIDTFNKLSKSGYVKLNGNNVSFNSEMSQDIYALKAIVAFRNYFRDWPEMVMLEIIKRAIEHGGVDEVWVPTFEDCMKENNDKDRRPYYDYAALRLGGVPFHPAMDITPDTGSDIWSNTTKQNYPKTWYAIDLLPYKLDLRKGVKCSDKQDPNSVATVTDLNKLTKFKKSLGTMTIITEKLVDSQIVVVYQLSTAPGKYFISSCKDFSDKYSTRQLYSSTDLKFSGDVYGSVYKDKVLRYVDRQLNDYPYLKDAPKNMLIASGITKRQEEFNLKPEEVQKLAEEMEQVSKIPMDLPIINYVKSIITIVEHVKQNSDLLLKSPEAFNAAIVRILKGLTLDETAIGMIKNVVSIVLPEALKSQTKYPKDEIDDLGFDESDLNELAPAGSPNMGEETLDTPDLGLADNDPRKKYDDLKFDNQQMSPQSLERHKQHLMDEYLDELAQAKSEGNIERIEKINKMLQYLSAESSLNFFEDSIMERLGGLHSAREMNLPLSHECRECGRNTMGNPSGLCAECRHPSVYPEQRYRPSKGLEFGIDYGYGNNGKTPKAEVSGGLKFEE
ncbi:MAG: pentapeptide repeat-containing protein [Synergistaceae bacterium]|jgi:hypothetical protein|nr:pentapeptide repeat-containing protein [Synergistaceae bacterium]